jgi:hypothetical protein
MPARKDHLLLSRFIQGLREDFDAALQGQPAVTFRMTLKTRVTLWSDDDGQRYLDFNEGKMNTELELEIEPSEITLARIGAHAKAEQLRILAEQAAQA